MICSAASPVNPVPRHAVAQLHLDLLHPPFGSLEAHRAPQLFGLPAGESGRHHRDAQQLLLKQRHAERARENRLERRMRDSCTGSRPARRFRYGCTIWPTIGPGRMIATSTTMS